MSFGSWLNDVTGATDSAKQQFKNQMKLQKDAQAYSTWQMQNAHQLEVADLEKAGINPIMTAGGGGASASVSQGSAQAGHSAGDALSAILSAISTAKGVQKTDAEIKNIEANTKQTETNTSTLPELNQSIIDLNNANTAKSKQEKRNLVTQNVYQELKNEITKIEKDINYTPYSINKRKEILQKTLETKMKEIEKSAKIAGINNKDWKIIYDESMKMANSFMDSFSPLRFGSGGNTYNFSQTVPTVNY